MSTEAFFRNKKRSEITCRLLQLDYKYLHYVCLSFMTPDVFAYFLAIYMRLAVEDIKLETDMAAYVIKTTPLQEEVMINYINESYPNGVGYNIAKHNCSTMVADSFTKANIGQKIITDAISQVMLPQLPPTMGFVGGMLSGNTGIQINQGASIPSYFSEFNHE